MKNEIINKLRAFDFHDGAIVDVRVDGASAVMLFKNWQEDIFKITFRGVVGFQAFEFPSDPEIIIRTASPFIDKCIESIEASKGTPAGYSNYEFVQVDCGEEGHPISIVFFHDIDIVLEKEL